MKSLKRLAAAAAMVALSGAAQAALISQGNGTVLDTDTKLIWLQDWNSSGTKTWVNAKTWAETTLDGFAGSNDWQLPEITEYAALFARYGDLSQVSAFTNVQSFLYWSGTDYAPNPLDAWIFHAKYGYQDRNDERNALYVTAVRDGNVTTAVPEPQTLALVMLGLGATVVARRRRQG